MWGDSLTFNCGGRAGPWTTPSSSLSPPKLVINSTFVFLGSSGERERDLDDEDLLKRRKIQNIYIHINCVCTCTYKGLYEEKFISIIHVHCTWVNTSNKDTSDKVHILDYLWQHNCKIIHHWNYYHLKQSHTMSFK